MKILRNALGIISLLIIFLFGLLFSIYNPQNVALDLIIISVDSVSVALFSGVLLAFGVVLGISVAMLSKFFESIENKRLKKELKVANEKLAKLAH